MAKKYKPSYVTVSKPGAAPAYKNTATAPAYKTTATAPAEYKIGTYTSKYGDQIDSALNTVTNWNYDPMQDASYQALAKVYGARGNQAAKNSLADAAALNGGYGTSYAVSAAQQARNQYNQELAALIPDLEQNAFNRAQVTYNALRDADDTDYGRFRDTEGDRQWKYGMDYQKYRDTVGDDQWKYSQDYTKYRDTVGDQQWLYSQNYQKYQDALSQYQWALDYNNTLYAQKQAAKGSGGGGGRRGSGGGGYVSSGSSSGSGMPNITLNPNRDKPVAGPTRTKGYTLDRLLAEGKKDNKSGSKTSSKKTTTKKSSSKKTVPKYTGQKTGVAAYLDKQKNKYQR